MLGNKQNSGKPLLLFFAVSRAELVAIVGAVWFQFRFASAFTDLSAFASPVARLLSVAARFNFAIRLFLRFAGDKSRGRPENPFQKARKRIATLRSDRGDFDQHIVGQAVTVRIGG